MIMIATSLFALVISIITYIVNNTVNKGQVECEIYEPEKGCGQKSLNHLLK